VAHAEKQEACQGDDRDETSENDDDSEDSQFLSVVETVEEDHTFSSSPGE
jgi:hypothetical protein